MRNEQEGRIGRGLLEDLEQRVGRRRIAVVDGVDDGDAVPCPAARHAHFLDEAADFLDADGGVVALAGFLGRLAHDEEVRIGAGRDLGSDVVGRLVAGGHEDATGEIEGECGLADAPGTVDQDAARQAAGIEAFDEGRNRRAVADDGVLVLGGRHALELIRFALGIVQFSWLAVR